MARRWIIAAVVAVVVVVAGITIALVARDDGAGRAAPTASSSPSTTRAPTTTTGPTTVPPSTAAPTTGAPAPTTTAAPPVTGSVPGPCGAATDAIRSAVDTGIAGAGASADLASCRLAASDPTYAAAQLTAKPGTQFPSVTVVLHSTGGAWAIVASGGSNAGCGQVPQQVIVDLGQFCLGSGGSAQ